MSDMQFHPEHAIGEGLLQLGKQRLLRFVSLLCLYLKAENGSRIYRGGIFPENICWDGDGSFAIGPAKMEKWSGQELEFIAPEMYWHGEASPAADVYSLALLVYYGLDEGKLPFDTATSSGQLARMSGKALPAPKNAGKRLAEVLEKATAFQASERYQTPGELQIMLESCMDNKYLSGNSGAEVVFKKEEEELSDIERMMVDIIEHGAEPEGKDGEEPVSLEGLSQEEIAGLEKPEVHPLQKEDISAAVEEFFGSVSDEETKAMPSLHADEAEEVRVYEPSREKKDRQPIPILTEEKYPELAPVVLHRQVPHLVESKEEKEEKAEPEEAEPISSAQEVRKRRSLRPLAIVLVVCLSLVAGALAVNLYWNRGARPTQINPTPDPQKLLAPTMQSTMQPRKEPTPPPIVVTTPTNAPQLTRYRVTVSDMSWTQARAACWDQGGYLAVISDQKELNEIIALAEAQNLTYVWIGCHRENDRMIWESGEEVEFYKWGANEPSKKDSYDMAREDYVLLRKINDQWYYNDCRDDPAGKYPDFFSGKMGFVVEFDR